MMTRIEYRATASNYISYINASFPSLLRDIAMLLFLYQDVTSEFALETRRRLLQLNETGITDD